MALKRASMLVQTMDSPIVARLLRQLFRHPACPSQRNLVALSSCIQDGRRTRQQRRSMASRPPRDISRGAKSDAAASNESKWQPRVSLYTQSVLEEYGKWPMVTADELRHRKYRPTKVKMLMRDFIEDSLYNPNYGYFSKQAVIFSPGEPFDFHTLPNEQAFHAELGRRYTAFEDALDARLSTPNIERQLWHTPTELFRPYYGESIARYLAENYRLTDYPYSDLIVYEMGAGRGTLMMNVLDYLRNEEPEFYSRTKYRIIEISSKLAALQNSQLLATAQSRGHADKVEIINRSIFDWNELISYPCFFIALEVFDNFAHDIIRYDQRTREPLQGVVLITASNDFYEFYEPNLDPVAARYLRVRHAATRGNYPVPFNLQSRLMFWAQDKDPNTPELSSSEYIPTRQMQFFDILKKFFPGHRLLTSDFHSLPNAAKGLNGPVVQTRYERQMTPVRTPLVHQGYFDILFPTDFVVMNDMYKILTGKLSKVETHDEFMRNWAFIGDTETQSGENPPLNWYKNASVMRTVSR